VFRHVHDGAPAQERIGAVAWFCVHLVACAVVAGTDLVVIALLDRAFLTGFASASFASVYQSELINHLDFSVILYWTTLGTIYMVEFHRRARQRELDAAQLRTRLVAAELEALRMQLNPHFLFNALQAASELMHSDPTNAARMLNRISALLRQALRGGTAPEIPLWQELELADAYLQIARLRFGRELEVVTDIEPDAVDVLVPGLVLQPLLENCFQHGFAGRVASPQVILRAQVVGDRLTLSVSDNGGRSSRSRPQGFGIGLSNTQARLLALYGDRGGATLRTEPLRDGGYRAEIELPARVRAPTASGALESASA
jgi:LytS/YehU family sensor histidine kinase